MMLWVQNAVFIVLATCCFADFEYGEEGGQDINSLGKFNHRILLL